MNIFNIDIISRILLILFIYFMSILSFYTFRNNKFSILTPYISILWLIILAFNENLWPCLFPNYGVFPPDIWVLVFGSIGLALALLFTGAIPYLIIEKKACTYTKMSCFQTILLSFFPVFMIISYVYYYGYEFLELAPVLFVVLVIIDKLILLIFEYYFVQTILKVMIVLTISIYLNYKVPAYILGEIIILTTDCITGYVLLQAKQDKSLKVFVKKICRKFKNRES